MEKMTKPVSLTTLSSGMKCAVFNTSSPVSYCALTTLAGTRFEPPGLSGLAHFCEHMLFKGTVRRKSYHINNRLERLGGEVNAFTTKEELVLHTTVLKEDTDKALELMSDLVFHSVFPDAEIIKEREVILDEIRSYKDSPMDLIYDRFEEKLFAGTPMATPILGVPRELRKITSGHMKQYVRERFVPERMALTIVGNIAPRRAGMLAERYYGLHAFSGKGVPREGGTAGTFSAGPATVFDETEKRGTYQTHCLTGSTAYPLGHRNRVPLVLLMNILGGPASNARLNMLLREKFGLVYTVEASYSPYLDTGFAGIYFGTDRPNLDRCRELTEKVLKEYATVSMTTLQLERAKKQLTGQMSVTEDNHEVQCLSMGKSILSFGKVITHGEMLSMISEITAAQVLEAARHVWDPSGRCTLVYF
ncbi:MAG: pitrilysin family protein [Bacteroidales bacterium]|nr:pitrilysin family protein [Bacteroidales bacterium]MDD4480197.1 pitrilysin family protein [Bacteroidales bacterium]MDD5713366.1 pitrilysin family protein [Bacteroidales bacterium]MDY0358767.1 pitrilysin family protein [Bacteroidales bacterium]NLN37133.1 insulinase family protein [Bacteroidales bacterium]